MDKRIIIAALSAAVILTACGKAPDKDQGESAAPKDSSKAVTLAEESSIAAEESSEEEVESSEADESSAAETEVPAESVPEISGSADTDPSQTETSAPAEPEIVHISGTGYGFDVDLSKWVDAAEVAVVNAENGSDGIEYIYGWLGDNSSTCMLASNENSTDLSQYDIDDIAQRYIENDDPPAGQSLIDWSTLDINGIPWIRREYTLDTSAFGVDSRILQYTGFNGYTEVNVCFTITETSVSDIDNDLRDLMWSVQFE
ncbi:hypothetical protein RASY3_10930 [Ruminococcus albus SY3]|uniref:Uncharacterized protein n=1 Tax=Ruminococcus albus SY3 TaxID=1341156 RepID=A0A011UZX7_RUMAL|nr:hypothetical protein [Ruminococcus albus]EXM38747.1 hypothetical protein RASY3_19620 [Ruminococcus albus SY3]EXM39134.1 hypothetical protein RASY3_10930 [Ruminococcus albus SY3]